MTTEAQIQGLGEFSRWEFTLEQDGAMSVFLLHEGEEVGRFIQTGATEESLQEECALHLAKYHGSDGCLWETKEAKDAS